MFHVSKTVLLWILINIILVMFSYRFCPRVGFGGISVITTAFRTLKDLVRNPLYKIMIFADLGVTNFQFFVSNFVINALFSLKPLLYDAHAHVGTDPRSKLDLGSKISQDWEITLFFSKKE